MRALLLLALVLPMSPPADAQAPPPATMPATMPATAAPAAAAPAASAPATNAPAATALPAATRKRPPPCAGPEHRQFDFWLGDWQVFDGSGKQVGSSHIESILGGCVIAEHWSSAGNHDGDGKSYNQFNAQTGHWEQFWVDAGGTRLILSGGLHEGAMVLEGAQAKADPKSGIAQRERITWTPNGDGSVRQFWQSSSDGGKTWTTAFDGLYKHPASG